MNFLHGRFDVLLEKIPEAVETSPDFTIVNNERQIAVAELKDIEYFPASEDRGWTMTKPGEPHYPFNYRDDNAVSRVASKIHEAYKQLRNSSLPRIIVFLNYDSLVDVKDLEEAFSGEHLYENTEFSYINTVSKKIAAGRIDKEKTMIDLYIWIDKSTQEIWFRYPTQTGFDLAHKYFI